MYFYHMKSPHGGVRVTIAGTYKDGVLKLSAARCSKKDQFNKKIGRKISSGRLNANNLIHISEQDDFTTKLFVNIAAKEAVKIAKFGLKQKDISFIPHI